MAKKKAAKTSGNTTRIEGDAARQLMDAGTYPQPPAEAFAGLPVARGELPGSGKFVRRGGRLVPVAAPAPQTAAPLPMPTPAAMASLPGLGLVGSGQSQRRFNPTFHEPAAEVQLARSMAQNLRQTLGITITQMELAMQEGQRTLAYLNATPAAVAEFEREGMSMAEVEKFIAEIDDVLRIFVPVETPSGS